MPPGDGGQPTIDTPHGLRAAAQQPQASLQPPWAPGLTVGYAPGAWPPRLARVWAHRAAFLCVALLAVCARLVYVPLCAVFAAKRDLASLIVESLACTLPLIWCAVTSRPPATSEAGIPASAVFGCPCHRLPRFTAFAVATASLELYSTMAAAWSVAVAPCDAPPWRVILPYGLGVVVAVVRIYSALLALRLQDDFISTYRRVLPDIFAKDGLQAALPPPCVINDLEAEGDYDFELELPAPEDAPTPSKGARPESPGTALRARAASPKGAEAGGDDCPDGSGSRSWPPSPAQASSMSPAMPPRPCCRRRWLCRRRSSRRPAAGSGQEAEEETDSGDRLASSAQGKAGSSRCKALRRLIGGRSTTGVVLRLGLVFVLLAALVSVLVIRAMGFEDPKPSLPSACITAQNATATCDHFEVVGDYWEPGTGDSHMGNTDTIEECCRACDEISGCQAWMFERMAKRCRWIRFLEAPCQGNPGDLTCRCLTHFGTVFGFKPTTPIIWVQRER